jgi:RimJ/RimL family protein N-acetyltransferase
MPDNFDDKGQQKYKLNNEVEKITKAYSLSNQVIDNWQNSIAPEFLQINSDNAKLIKLNLDVHGRDLYTFTQTYPDMFTYTNFGPFYDQDELVNWFKGFHEIWHHYCLRDKTTNSLLAIISLIVIALDSGIAELSLLMVPPQLYEGTLLEELITLVLKELFCTLGYRRCQFRCNADDYKSFHYLDKFAVFEGILRNNFIISAQSYDSALFAITVEDFNATLCH